MNELTKRTNDKYKAKLRKDLEENGLYKSVSKRLDVINVISADLRWLRHAYIQEMIFEILDLIEMRSK